MTTYSGFQWFSALGISVMLFMIYGAFYMLIGILTPIFMDASIGKPGIIISYRTDRALFGDEPVHIMKENKPLEQLRKILLPMLAAMLVVSGLSIFSIAFWGLRAGQFWSIIVLTLVGLVVLPYWWLVFKPYLETSIKITLADAPPFIWVPAMLYLPAIILGWIGMR